MLDGMIESELIGQRQREFERIAVTAEFARRQWQEAERASVADATRFGRGPGDARVPAVARLARPVSAAWRAVRLLARGAARAVRHQTGPSQRSEALEAPGSIRRRVGTG